MLLALGLGVLDQRDVVELVRLRQDGACHLDRVVERELADQFRRCIRDCRQPLRERRPRRLLDIGNEMAEDAVEHRDMVAGEMARSEDEEIGDAAQRLFTALGGAVRQRVFKLAKESVLSGHRGQPRDGENLGSFIVMLEFNIDIQFGRELLRHGRRRHRRQIVLEPAQQPILELRQA